MRSPLSCCLYFWSALSLLSVGCPGEDQGGAGGGEPDLAMPDDLGTGDLASPPDAASRPRPTLTAGAADRFLLRGTVLTPGGPLLGELLVEGKAITCVAASCAAEPGAAGATTITTSGIILPGLIDAHNHGLFNIFDEGDWTPPRVYANHNDWTSDTRYSQVVDAKQYLASESTSPVDLRCEMDKYAELKALLAGTTSFTLAPGAVDLVCYQSAVRTIDTSRNGLGSDRVRTSISVPTTASATSVCADFTAGTANAYLVHIGEGTNAAARNEFTTLEGRAGGCLMVPQTTIVHGTALTTAEFTKMATAGMKLVWSPKSNLFLYNDTTRIDLAIAAGVQTIALAPDWALGGSVNLLDELRVARDYAQQRWPGLLSSRRLFEMVTIEPARVLGVDTQIGSLEKGKRADIVLLQGDPSQPYEALLSARPTNIEMVMVDGRVMYGDPELKSAGPAAPGCETLQVCSASKFLCLAESATTNKLNQTFTDISSALTSNLASYDTLVAPMNIPAFSPIAPLTKCP